MPICPHVSSHCVDAAPAALSARRRRLPLAFLRLSLAAALLLAGTVFVTPAVAQSDFGQLAVGSSSTASVTVTSRTSGSVASVKVLTAGAANMDFTDAGGACATASFASAGLVCQESVTFKPLFPGQRLGAVVLLDGTGAVIGSGMIQGTGLAGLAVFAPGNEHLVAGNGSWSQVGDGSLAVDAGLDLPASVAVDGAGNLYIADSQHHRIRMVSSGTGATVQNSVAYPQAGYITTIAGKGSAGYAGDGALASSSSVELDDPSGVAVDGAGNIYIADTGNNVVREIVAATGVLVTVAGTGTLGNTGDGGLATSAELNGPLGVTVDPAGNLFIADTGNHEVRVVCAAAGTVLNVACPAAGDIVTVAGSGYTDAVGDGGYSGDDGPAIAADLNFPYAVAFDAAGDMYIPDSSNNRIRMVTPAGVISTFAGVGTPGYYGDGGLATSAYLQVPSSVAVDAAQNVYISDAQNSAIRKVSAQTGEISTVIKSSVGTSYNGTKIVTNSLYAPKGIALDPYGNLYIAVFFGMTVQSVQSNVALLDFTATPTIIGNTSSSGNQTLENDGNAPLTLNSITQDANSLLMAAGTTCDPATPLAVDNQCVVQAEFAPVTTGDPLFAQVTIDAQTGNNPLQLIVAGDAPPVNSTTINVSSSQNPSVFGQAIVITATVATGSGTGALTGTLSFYDGATLLQSSVALNSLGTGTYTTTALTVGSHVITAVYSGDSNHYSSSSSPFTQVVNENTAVALVSSANPATLGAAVTLTATVSISGGGGVTPDGQVAFLDGTTLLNTVSINTSGVATLTIPAGLSQGAHVITAVYSGDSAKYINGATSSAVDLNVIAQTTLAIVSTPNPSTYGNTVAFTATLSYSGTGHPTGAVNFYDGSLLIGTQQVATGSNAVTFTTSSLSVGAHAVSAAYAGDADFGSSTAGAVTQTVTSAQTAVVLVPGTSPAIAGVAVTLTATITPASGSVTATGTVTFYNGATSIGTASVASNNTASIPVTFAAGVFSLTAKYSGDSNITGSQSPAVSLEVDKGVTHVALTSSAATATVLSSVTFTAVVTSNGVLPTGNISFSIDGGTPNTMALDGTGTATFTDSGLAVGSHTIIAQYEGNSLNASAASSGLSEVITAIPTVTNLTQASSGGNTPQTVLIATTTGTSGTVPTGTVTFTTGSTTLGSVALDAGGVATLVPSLSPGTYSVVAQYGGDLLHAASTSEAVSITGTAANFTVNADPSSLSLSAGQHGTITLTVTSISDYADSVQMGCLGLPALVTCHFSVDTIDLQANQTQKVVVTIDTNSPLAGGSSASAARPGSVAFASLCLPASVLFGLLLFGFRKRNRWLFLVLLVCSLPAALVMTGCGSVTNNTASPGTYSVQLGGTGATTKVSSYETIAITVTK